MLPISIRGKKKKSTKGKFKLLHDLSFPYDDTSVNANIPDSAAKVSYTSVLEAFDIINNLGSCFLAKSDIADAYRIVPLHPSQYPLTGFKLKGSFYFDKCLPMGARSACQFFFLTYFIWISFILKNLYKVSFVIKLLDDFLFFGKFSEECRYGLECFRNKCARVGVIQNRK